MNKEYTTDINWILGFKNKLGKAVIHNINKEIIDIIYDTFKDIYITIDVIRNIEIGDYETFTDRAEWNNNKTHIKDKPFAIEFIWCNYNRLQIEIYEYKYIYYKYNPAGLLLPGGDMTWTI